MDHLLLTQDIYKAGPYYPHKHLYKAVRERVPFWRHQMDLVGIKPISPEGYCQVLTVICVAVRYPYFRPLKGKDAKEVAFTLFVVILDIGVVPRVIQSDLGTEFKNAVEQRPAARRPSPAPS